MDTNASVCVMYDSPSNVWCHTLHRVVLLSPPLFFFVCHHGVPRPRLQLLLALLQRLRQAALSHSSLNTMVASLGPWQSGAMSPAGRVRLVEGTIMGRHWQSCVWLQHRLGGDAKHPWLRGGCLNVYVLVVNASAAQSI